MKYFTKLAGRSGIAGLIVALPLVAVATSMNLQSIPVGTHSSSRIMHVAAAPSVAEQTKMRAKLWALTGQEPAARDCSAQDCANFAVLEK